jgi:hypothetical protein
MPTVRLRSAADVAARADDAAGLERRIEIGVGENPARFDQLGPLLGNGRGGQR